MDEITRIELALIGGAVLRPECINETGELADTLEFDDPNRGKLWRHIVAMRSAREGISVAALHCEAKLLGCVDVLRSALHEGEITNARHLARQIADEANNRKLRALHRDLGKQIASGEKTPAELVEWFIAEAADKQFVQSSRPRLIGEILQELAERQEDPARSPVKTGLREVDDTLAGFMPGQLILIGARPSMGKSALGYQFANFAAERDCRSLYVSIEMPDTDLGARQLAGECQLKFNDIVQGRFDESDRQRARDSAARNSDLPLLLWSPSAPTVEQIVATIRCEKARGPLKLVIVDYVSLIRSRDPKKPYWQQIGDISVALKNAAKQLDVPIVLLSQLSRDSEKDAKPKRPSLSELKYSGSLEQDADVVLLLHRASRIATAAELIIAKARNASCKLIDLFYDGPRFMFTDSRVQDHKGYNPEFAEYAG